MRIGIDLGGTKIEGIVMGEGSRIVARQRISTPAGNYEATLDALCGLAKRLEAAAAVGELPIGVGSPGALSKTSGLMKNCSSTCLNGKPLLADLEHRLGARVRLANDADCLALSEARDGAA
ncbi:MAG TPA: ROK family protein, partial [Solimonas sp.]